MRPVALLVALALAAPVAHAQEVPGELPHQGRILDNGTPVDGSYSVRFAFYRNQTGGSPAWSENQTIEFDRGYYSVVLGGVTPIPASLVDGATLWLGIKIGPANELARVPVSSVPYARRASVAADVTGDINPRTVSVNGSVVIDASGAWVGDTSGLQGPAGEDADPVDVAAALTNNGAFVGNVATSLATNHAATLRGPQGPQGPAGPNGSPDDGATILSKLNQVDGASSGLDADRLDGISSEQLVASVTQGLTGADLLTKLAPVDGANSGLDADRLDGLSSEQLTANVAQNLTAADLLTKILTVDGTGSQLDADKLDGLSAQEVADLAGNGIDGVNDAVAILVTGTGTGSVGTRSIKVAGTAATFSANDGLAMVVVDRDTYGVVTSVNGITVTRNFEVNTLLSQWSVFQDAVSQLDYADHLVVLASKGPIDRYLYTPISSGGPTPASLLDDLGADIYGGDITATSAFALVGYPDIGVGNGLMTTVDASVGTHPTAQIAGLVLDGILTGAGDDDGWRLDQESDRYRFTTCGQTGRTGPSQSQCNTAYANTTLASGVTVTNGIQTWTVPRSGIYRVTAWGAEGAVGTYDGGTHGVGLGGRGAKISGEFALAQGTVLKILVGQMGVAPGWGAYAHQPGGGGGGTFVATSTNTPVIVAGGGGGGQDPSYGFAQGGHGRVETSGESVMHHSSYQSTGGTNGSGGVNNTSNNNYVGTGAGFTGNGTAVGNVGAVAQSFVNGGVGGYATNHATTAHGGFGGGGHGELCPGGGGGYSGGGACCGWSSYARSGGGGSYNSGTNQTNDMGEHIGHGMVEFVYLR
jgi:hypothetical protein